MTLLRNRPTTSASQTDIVEQAVRVSPNTSAVPAPGGKGKASAVTVPAPTDALRTLRERLQAQLDSSDGVDDVETRAVLQSARKRLNQVNASLARIEEGKYGVCADCDKPIESDRIVLQPFSTRCIGCQTIAEWHGHTY